MRVVFVTLVHPDLLPPVYASARVLADLGYEVPIVSSDSTVASNVVLGAGVSLHTCGKYIGSKYGARRAVRNRILAALKRECAGRPAAIVCFCAFSYLAALQVAGGIPVIYIALEITDFGMAELRRSPLTAIRNWKTLRKVPKAHLVATPTVQRSAWLAGRARLQQMPLTVQNTGYSAPDRQDYALFSAIVPQHLQGKTMLLYTGAVNATLGVLDMVKGFARLKNGSHCCLAITRFGDNAYCREIRTFIDQAGIADRVVLLPNLPREQMEALQQNAHVGITFVKEEPGKIKTYMIAPNKVGEYLANGLFVLGSDVEYMRQFRSAGVAVLTPSLEPDAIAATMEEAVRHVATGNMKSRISDFVRTEFSMQVQFGPVAAYIDKLSGRA